MDTTEQYIKMCEKAVEVQEAWKPMPGDFIFRKFTLFGEEIDRQIWEEDQSCEINIIYWDSIVDGYYACTNEKGESRTYKHPSDMRRETSIWLPRQDQLQEMVKQHYDCTTHNVRMAFYWWYSDQVLVNASYELWTDESLWLAFVMKEKFSKIWNGEDWNETT